MDASEQRLTAVLTPVVEGLGLVLEGVRVRRTGGQTQVEVTVDVAEDDPDDLDLDRVAVVTQAVSDGLDAGDVLPGAYVLEVSSPGAERPLTQRRHFVRAVGRLVTLTVDDGRTLTGRLVAVDGDELEIAPRAPVRKGRPAKELASERLSLTAVRSGHVEVDLTGLAAHDEDGRHGGDEED
ncbi:MAG: ribosome maturation factor RimP [Actinobacteria bacterium]|nr:ribosome maturation factor RimP [Actinomycetota bacterium]